MSIRARLSAVPMVIGAVTGLLAVMPASEAALVQLCGPSICYEYDDNPLVNSGIAFYGAPTLLAGSNTLKFTPTVFAADSAPETIDIPGPTVTTVFAFSRVWSTVGSEIGVISVTESGDYQILGNASVAATLRLQVVDLNGVLPSGFPDVAVDLHTFSSSTETGFAMANWSLTSAISPAALFSNVAQSVDLSIQNTLQAFSGPAGGYGFIAKKLLLTAATVSEIPPTVVPVPAAAWLLGSALGLLGVARRRAAGAGSAAGV